MEEFIVAKFQDLLDDILPRLTKKPGRVIAVVPGNQIAWDDCCQGQLTCRLVSMTPVLAEGSSMAQCGIKYWQAIGEVALLRCSQALDDRGNAPKPSIVRTEGVEGLSDSDVLLKSIGDQNWISSISSWMPLGPQGGCKGIQIQFNFNLDQPK